MNRLRLLFAHRWCVWLLPVLGMLMLSPTVTTGLIGDDYAQRQLLIASEQEGAPPLWQTLNRFFTFADGQAEHVRELRDEGRLPWWSHDELRLSFWRPLSAFTHWVDHRLWPDRPELQHAHNVLWYGLSIAVLVLLYRRLERHGAALPFPVARPAVSPAVSGLAAFLFATSALHAFPVAWIAARNQILSVFFTGLVVLTYHLWRTGHGRAHLGLALLALALGLMAAEGSIAAVGYLVAYALALDQRHTWARRLTALLPFVGLVLLWRVGYDLMGYGSAGSGAYIDPGADPLRFAQALLLRLPVLLQSGLFALTSSIAKELSPAKHLVFSGVSLALVALTGWAAGRLGLWSSPLARFAVLGAVLALVPMCAADPNDRLLFNAEIGLSLALALLLVRAWQQRALPGWKAHVAKGVVALLALIHLLIFPVLTVLASSKMGDLARPAARDEPLSVRLPAGRAPASTDVILINPMMVRALYFYPDVRRHFGAANPSTIRGLAGSTQELQLQVLDAHSFIVKGERALSDSMSRDIRRYPFRVGDQVDVRHVRITIEAVTPEGAPTAARFRFNKPLRDAGLSFQAWRLDSYEPLQLPAPGETITLPKVNLRAALRKSLNQDDGGDEAGEAPARPQASEAAP